MAETAQKARKWNGFVCPECRFVFRVARDHDGQGVVCPSCRRMLRLPNSDDEIHPLVIPGHAAEPHHDDGAAAGATESSEQGKVKKRRRSNRKKDQVFDETFARKTDVSPNLVRGLIGSVGLFGAILLVALLWPSGENPDSVGTNQPLLIAVETENEEKDELAIEAERAVVSPKLIEAELEPVYRKFLNAESPEEMARWVRHPEVTLPRIRDFFGEDFVPEGFSSIVWSRPQLRTGEAIKAVIEDGNFVRREIFAVNEGGWKVDWESWAGWSELSWDKMKKSRTTDPVLFRVMVSDVSYYNFSFADESRWSSYRLEPLDGNDSLYGYVQRAGELDSRLKSLEEIENRLFTLKLRYPEDSPSGNQVIVEEIVTEGWFTPDDPS